MCVSLVARQEFVAASLLFQWRKLDRQVALTAVCAGEAVVQSSKLAAARAEIAKPQHQRSLGRGDDNDLDQQVWSSQLGLACGAGGTAARWNPVFPDCIHRRKIGVDVLEPDLRAQDFFLAAADAGQAGVDGIQHTSCLHGDVTVPHRRGDASQVDQAVVHDGAGKARRRFITLDFGHGWTFLVVGDKGKKKQQARGSVPGRCKTVNSKGGNGQTAAAVENKFGDDLSANRPKFETMGREAEGMHET